jgi:DNA-binding transcriptional regulator YdaS (Cro superfamily)
MKKDSALIDLIVTAGSQAKLAQALGVSRAAIHYWRQVPIKHLLAIETLYNIPRQALRPDLYGGHDEAQSRDRPAVLADRVEHRRDSRQVGGSGGRGLSGAQSRSGTPEKGSC